MQYLIGLNPSDYEHPLDHKFLSAVKGQRILATVVNAFMNWTQVKWEAVALCGSNFHVTREACPKLYDLLQETSKVLDLTVMPPVYIQQHYDINAFTFGYDRDSYVVLNAGTVDKLGDAELRFVVGHEMGHIKSGHVLYNCLGAYLSTLLSKIPIVGAEALGLPIEQWRRMSEFTADRAGLLACQDLNASLNAIMKMSGLPEKYYETASLDGFIKQAEEFDTQYGGTTDQIIKTLTILTASHPWTVFRASELIKWYNSGEYEKVLRANKGKTCINGHPVASNAEVCPYCGSRHFRG